MDDLKQEEMKKTITTVVVVAEVGMETMKQQTTVVVVAEVGMETMKQQGEEEQTVTTVVVAAAAAVNWLNLPKQLTTHIMSKLTSICDYARFGAVCNQWRSIFLQNYSYCKRSFLPQSQLPLLMIPTPPPPVKKNKKRYGNNNYKKNVSFGFYRVTDGKIYERLRFAMPRERYVRGSGYGWLITVDNDEICCSIQLMNPFLYPPNYSSSTREIKLPSVITHPHEECDPGYVNYIFFQKAILSADPITNPKDFIVMAIFGGAAGLSFCKPGDEAWTPIEHSWIRSMFYDLVHYQGKFYALSKEGSVVVCNLVERTVTKIAEPPVSAFYCNKNYLVVSDGELFQVRRNFNRRYNKTKQFKVFKLKGRREASTEWVEVQDLGDRTFFIGDNPSMSISPADFPGCKPNCIYYTDDAELNQIVSKDDPAYLGARDLGVFNLGNGKFEKHYYPKVANIKLWPPPIWIEPTLTQRRNIVRKSLC